MRWPIHVQACINDKPSHKVKLKNFKVVRLLIVLPGNIETNWNTQHKLMLFRFLLYSLFSLLAGMHRTTRSRAGADEAQLSCIMLTWALTELFVYRFILFTLLVQFIQFSACAWWHLQWSLAIILSSHCQYRPLRRRQCLVCFELQKMRNKFKYNWLSRSLPWSWCCSSNNCSSWRPK